MKTGIKILIMALSFMVVTSSCKKDVNEPKPSVPSLPNVENTENSMNEKFKNYLESQKQSFSVSATTPNTIYGQKGTKIYLNGNNFEDGNGNPLTGNVDVVLVENYSRRDMVMTNKVTMVDNGTNSSTILESGGEFYMEISQNGNLVEVKNPLVVTTAPTNSPGNSMQLFDGQVDSQGNINWVTNTDTLAIVQDSFGLSYQFDWADSLSWTNVDQFMDPTIPQTDVTVNLPSGFDNTNTVLFVVFNNANSVANIYNFASGAYTTVGHYYTFPEGEDVTFVAISDNNNQLQYAIIQNAIITTNHTETIAASDFTSVTDMAALDAALSAYF